MDITLTVPTSEALTRGVTKTQHDHDRKSAEIASRLGMDGSLRLLMEARVAGLSQSLALALRTQESGIKGDGNVFGHDPTIFVGAGEVTEAKYLAYKRARGPRGAGGMQGVGPLQLTFYTFQDRADKLGGCWLVRFNYQVGFEDLAHLMQVYRGKDNPTRWALAVYNGGAARPNWKYAREVLQHQHFWHEKLT